MFSLFGCCIMLKNGYNCEKDKGTEGTVMCANIGYKGNHVHKGYHMIRDYKSAIQMAWTGLLVWIGLMSHLSLT